MNKYVKESYKVLIEHIMDKYFETFLRQYYDYDDNALERVSGEKRLEEMLDCMAIQHRKFIKHCYETKPELQSFIIWNTH